MTYTDHASLAEVLIEEPDKAQVHATLALVEQQRISNLIALSLVAYERFGNYAGPAGGLGTLFTYGPTPGSNMGLAPEIAAALGVTQTTDTPAQKREFRTVGVGYTNIHATSDSALVDAVGPFPHVASWNRSRAGKLTAQYRVVGPWTDLPDTLERTVYESGDPAPDMPVNDVRTSDGVWYHRSGLTGWRGRWDEWDRDWSSLPFPLTYIHPHTAKPEENPS